MSILLVRFFLVRLRLRSGLGFVLLLDRLFFLDRLLLVLLVVIQHGFDYGRYIHGLALPAGLEPATGGLEIRYSIHLSYGSRS